MPQITEESDDDGTFDPVSADQIRRADLRKQLTSTLKEIAAEVTAAFAEAGIKIPIYFSVPISGNSLLTFATPTDPGHEDWNRATEIVCAIVSAKVGIEGLRASNLPCIAAGAPPALGAADVLDGDLISSPGE